MSCGAGITEAFKADADPRKIDLGNLRSRLLLTLVQASALIGMMPAR